MIEASVVVDGERNLAPRKPQLLRCPLCVAPVGDVLRAYAT